MKKLILAMAVSASALVAPLASAATYSVDASHTAVNFKISHLGFSWMTGAFTVKEGSFSWDESKPEASSIMVSIDTTSIDSNHAERDKHLKSKDFLMVDKYPESTFKSTGYKSTGEGKGEVTGDLTLRGVTKSIVIPVSLVGEGEDPWGGYRAGFTGVTTIMLGDYGMDGYLGNAPVEMSLNIEGIRK